MATTIDSARELPVSSTMVPYRLDPNQFGIQDLLVMKAKIELVVGETITFDPDNSERLIIAGTGEVLLEFQGIYFCCVSEVWQAKIARCLPPGHSVMHFDVELFKYSEE
jgi:hypothetical protein